MSSEKPSTRVSSWSTGMLEVIMTMEEEMHDRINEALRNEGLEALQGPLLNLLRHCNNALKLEDADFNPEHEAGRILREYGYLADTFAFAVKGLED